MLLRTGAVASASLLLLAAACAIPCGPRHSFPGRSSTAAPGSQEPRMPQHAKGTFEVKLTPKDLGEKAKAAGLGAYSLEKQIHGDLEGSSVGEMLSADSGVKGSGAYVAVERITGTLKGRSGSFALYHNGVMTQGVPHLSINVVPDSGAGQLAGISGVFDITITGGKHFYDFSYSLPGHHE